MFLLATEHHIKTKSSYRASHQDEKFLRSINRSNELAAELLNPSPHCALSRALAARVVVTPCAALPSPHALVRVPAVRRSNFRPRRIICSLSWSLRHRLPRQCFRSRRSRLGAHGALLLRRRPSGRSGRSCVVRCAPTRAERISREMRCMCGRRLYFMGQSAQWPGGSSAEEPLCWCFCSC